MREALSRRDQAQEYIMMGLRLAEGLDVGRFTHLAGSDLSEEKLAHLIGIGMVETDRSRLKATRDGRAVLNAVIRELLAG